jgi:pyruvate formate lyase activating enzyme
VSDTLQVETYGRLASVYLDPIEKKPLYHFFPGRPVLSIGSVGCNMQCAFCQNCDISQVGVKDYVWLEEYTIEKIVKEASSVRGNIGIAFTYNEPVINYEFVTDVAHAIHAVGLKNVLVTNGYINQKPLEELLPYIDAFNVDLKAFSENFYHKQTQSHLEPVKQTLITLRNNRKHLEITNLIVPELNDKIEEFDAMTSWIADQLGSQVVLHISKYFPKYQTTKPPTPDSTLKRFYEIARKKLKYVYLGNAGKHLSGRDTICPECGMTIIERDGYQTAAVGLGRDGNCKKCGTEILVNV